MNMNVTPKTFVAASSLGDKSVGPGAPFEPVTFGNGDKESLKGLFSKSNHQEIAFGNSILTEDPISRAMQLVLAT
jgi:hypothetical protein